jgi:hypothetical protein
VSLKAAAYAGLALTLGCSLRQPAPSHGTPFEVLVAAPDLPIEALDAVSARPPSAVLKSTRLGRSLALTLAANSKVELLAPNACPLALGSSSTREELRLVPRLRLSGPAGEVGYDSNFEVTLRTRCGTRAPGTVAWEVSGAPLASFTTLEGGYRIVARTSAAPARLTRAKPGEVVAISADERRETHITARWTGPDGDVAQSSIAVSAASRARGLPNVALGDRVLLGGGGYRVRQRPAGSAADPMPWGTLTSLVPDVAGTWELSGEGGSTVRLFVSRYDSVPLDCGRAECHVAETHAAESSPMTSAFKRFLDEPGTPSSVACTFGCHTTGEPGRADGGFSHALAELGMDPGALPSWAELPRGLRRLGGVSCLGCHGPGQLPEAAARSTILRSEVCAYCHDAPPRYGHVKAWQSSALAESDRQPSTRARAACARCHTTWGFLDAVKAGREGIRMPPPNAPPAGISCSACHAVHDERAVMPGLLRRVEISSDYADLPESAVERSSACIYCHTPTEFGGPSSSAIWAGRGALDPITSQPLLGPAPHAAVPSGCVGCHRGGPESLQLGKGHAFRADLGQCASCHAERAIPDVRARAEKLLIAAGQGPRSGPPAHSEMRTPITPRGRALALVRFVLEDRGAAVHNPRYAEALLDRAEQVLSLPNSHD